MMPTRPKRVWVTGAAKGIGAAIVREALQRGHHVHATDVDEDGLRSLHAAHPQITTRPLDVRDLDAWTRMTAELERSGARVDVLINNAGVCRAGRVDSLSAEDERLTIEVNLFGVMNGVRALLPIFQARGAGHFINVASMAAFAPTPELAAYCASKHAVRAYTHSCAIEHRRSNIAWTVACPSAVETPMLQEMRERRAGLLVFTERAMRPDVFARAVVDTIHKPAREVLVPKAKGRLLRFLGLFPALISRGADGAERQGAAAIDAHRG